MLYHLQPKATIDSRVQELDYTYVAVRNPVRRTS